MRGKDMKNKEVDSSCVCCALEIFIVTMRRHQKKVLLPFLHVLKTIKPRDRTIILAHLDDVTRDALYETIANVLSTPKLPMRKRLFLKSKLQPYKADLRFLADKKNSSSKKKKKLTQMGGGAIGHVLGTAVPLLLNLFAK
jgi:hypothetical protein